MGSVAMNSRIHVDARPTPVYLPYVPPYDWETLLATFRTHQIPDLEAVNEVEYERVIHTSAGMGWFRVTHHADRNSLRLQLWNASEQDLGIVSVSVRRMFDLDADLGAIGLAMKAEPSLFKLWKRYPGLRIPRSWSGFESMLTTVLGQLVSVSFGRTLASELMQAAGTKVTHPKTGAAIRLFPTAKQLLKTDLSTVRTSESRRVAIRSLATLVVDGVLKWDQPVKHDELRKTLLSVPGIGPWTAEYVTMHGFHDDDAFPATDFGLKQELKRHPGINVSKVQPWRAYAAATLWKSFAHSR
jgi:3-methyladenine DNA glycosylase/8-oxoguanine DNA glycosylase